ncbi:hypothetical protein N7499_003440 [Penicillium canescens]|uniref:Uncharacterized protein n=1 Tax=Penicillium canescens TaxID=5083 RepID=A0AAD6I938_PENCN|nr:uncharacterized protein N7446_012366 [Penicillium canescens]KAJ6038093.1 hypothetical protein N7460_007864 [Penicillium canescens]KAJ6045502.1 hypothetical protein N7446_012366 [Penicillium canescens]KAJ6061184.1 hypothetical protein N7444_001880 [Penicillium canescens]KAJ6090726.1 hypothetical protein N7499_003440 [Penicillium canescens]KAJ6174910.1 hypothetical protein N7485_004715 [Penicillium canescens]
MFPTRGRLSFNTCRSGIDIFTALDPPFSHPSFLQMFCFQSISFMISKHPILSTQAPQMSYLPPGWTLERLQTATVDDLRQIPEDRLHKIDDNLFPIENVPVRLVIGRAIHNEHRRKVRAERGLPPAPSMPLFEKNDDPAVKAVERGGFDDFGSIVFRTDYSDEQRWEQWHKEFHRIIDASMEGASGGRKIEDKCFIPTYEDEDMADATHKQILQAYYEYQETEGVLPGLDIGMCVVVDSAVIDSITTDKPWIYVLDLSFHHESQLADGEYPGYFRVAVESLITELYPMLTAMTPSELWPSDNRIWESAVE